MEENKRETQALNLEGRKREFPTQVFQLRVIKDSDLISSRKEGNNLCIGQVTQLVKLAVNTIVESAYTKISTAMNVDKGDIGRAHVQNFWGDNKG